MVKPSWQVITEFAIATYSMESDWLLFHSGTGATHRLNGVYGLIFEAFLINKTPLTIDDLLASTSQYHLNANEIKQAVESLLMLHIIRNVD